MKFVNLTPHAITFMCGESNIIIPASGNLARVSVKSEVIGAIDGIPVTESVYGSVQGLPDPVEGTIYIVSSLVAQRCPDRRDVFIPSDSVRDEQGRIIGCRSLGCI